MLDKEPIIEFLKQREYLHRASRNKEKTSHDNSMLIAFEAEDSIIRKLIEDGVFDVKEKSDA